MSDSVLIAIVAVVVILLLLSGYIYRQQTGARIERYNQDLHLRILQLNEEMEHLMPRDEPVRLLWLELNESVLQKSIGYYNGASEPVAVKYENTIHLLDLVGEKLKTFRTRPTSQERVRNLIKLVRDTRISDHEKERAET